MTGQLGTSAVQDKGTIVTEAAAHTQKTTQSQGSAQSSGGASKKNYFMVVFIVLLEAMQVRQGTVLTQSKEVTANAAAQNKLNKENGQIKYAILPPGADNATINRVQEENQQYAAMREDIQNELITTRQNGQVEMTQTSTNVNILQQDTSENSKWIKALNTIFNVINQMSPGR